MNTSAEALYAHHYFGSLAASPCGHKAVFTLYTPNQKEDCYASDIFIYEENIGVQQVTYSGKWENPLWISSTLLVGREEDGSKNYNFYSINLENMERHFVFSYPKRAEVIGWYNGKVYFTAAASPITSADIEEQQAYSEIYTYPFAKDGEGFIQKHYTRLYMFNTLDSTIAAVTENGLDIQAVSFDEEKGRIAYSASAAAPIRNEDACLYCYDCQTQRKQQYAMGLSIEETGFCEDAIIIGAYELPVGCMVNKKLYRVDIQKGEAVPFNMPDISIGNFLEADSRFTNGKSFAVDAARKNTYLISTINNSVRLCMYSMKNGCGISNLSNGSIEMVSAKKGVIYYIGMRNMGLPELYTLREGCEQPLTSFNSRNQHGVQPLELSYINKNRQKNQGYIYYPKDFDKDAVYPAMVMIHGGQRAVYGQVFSYEIQQLVENGYFVLCVNPVGGGRGSELKDTHDFFDNRDYDGILRFLQQALDETPAIDPQRMGVIGSAYGACLACILLSRTRMFKAAVLKAAIANGQSLMALSQEGLRIYNLFREKKIEAAQLWENSPLKESGEIEAPVLLLHGEKDYVIPYTEGLQLFTALKLKGVTAKYCLFRNEGHRVFASGKPSSRIRAYNETLAWIKKYI